MQVKPFIENLSFQVTRCDWFVDCALAKLLLRERETSDQWQVPLDNLTKEAKLTVSEVDVVMASTQSTNGLMQPQVNKLAKMLSAGVNSIPVEIDPDLMSPDSYKGHLRFTVTGLEDPVTIPTSLNVRNGPFWALVAIVVGILVGRMARDMESPIAQKQIKLLPRWYKLQHDVLEGITDQSAQKSLKNDLHSIKKSMESSIDTIELTSKLLDELAAKVDILLDLQVIENSLLATAVKAQIVASINTCRDHMLRGQIEEARIAREEIVTKIENLKRDGNMSIMDNVNAAFARVSSFAEASMKNVNEALVKARNFQENLGRRLLVALSGIQVTAETRFWFFRPLISLLILVLLMLLGFQTLYVKSGFTFGVGGLYDYLGLFLWGISADVAQRTLFNLPQGK